jgi:transcription elongation GreA/GreB family factor
MSAETKRLAAAHAKVAETRASLAAAVKTEAAAKTLLDNAEKEHAKYLRRHRERTSERAAKMMTALKLGAAPAIAKKSVALETWVLRFQPLAAVSTRIAATYSL